MATNITKEDLAKILKEGFADMHARLDKILTRLDRIISKEKRLVECLADIKAGRVRGPFSSAKQVVHSLRSSQRQSKNRS